MGNSKILDDALKHGRAEQEKELVIDFDQAIQEAKKNAITVKYKGKEYKIPAETPEWYRLLINRKMAAVADVDVANMTEGEMMERANISNKENEDIYRRLFGDEFVEAYLNDNFVNLKNFNETLLAPIVEKWGWKPITDTTDTTKKKEKTPGS